MTPPAATTAAGVGACPYSYTGQVGEYGIYNAALNAQQILDLEAYLRAKYLLP
jgi:hypothetical protein